MSVGESGWKFKILLASFLPGGQETGGAQPLKAQWTSSPRVVVVASCGVREGSGGQRRSCDLAWGRAASRGKIESYDGPPNRSFRSGRSEERI